MPILEARELVKSYGRRRVVKGVSLALPSGEIIGLLGRNGAGKTTIFQMIVGLLKPDGGRILLDDEDITPLATDKRAGAGLTYLPQENSIFLKATVRDNLRLFKSARWICAPCHNIQPVTPTRNVVAMFEAIHAFGAL